MAAHLSKLCAGDSVHLMFLYQRPLLGTNLHLSVDGAVLERGLIIPASTMFVREPVKELLLDLCFGIGHVVDIMPPI